MQSWKVFTCKQELDHYSELWDDCRDNNPEVLYEWIFDYTTIYGWNEEIFYKITNDTEPWSDITSLIDDLWLDISRWYTVTLGDCWSTTYNVDYDTQTVCIDNEKIFEEAEAMWLDPDKYFAWSIVKIMNYLVPGQGNPLKGEIAMAQIYWADYLKATIPMFIFLDASKVPWLVWFNNVKSAYRDIFPELFSILDDIPESEIDELLASKWISWLFDYMQETYPDVFYDEYFSEKLEEMFANACAEKIDFMWDKEYWLAGYIDSWFDAEWLAIIDTAFSNLCVFNKCDPACQEDEPTEDVKGNPKFKTQSVDPDCDDIDKDWYPAYVDCNDNDASIHPNANEVCNGKDDNCDRFIPADERKDAQWKIACMINENFCWPNGICNEKCEYGLDQDCRREVWHPEICNNGEDDDKDGYTDCLDEDCAYWTNMSTEATNISTCELTQVTLYHKSTCETIIVEMPKLYANPALFSDDYMDWNDDPRYKHDVFYIEQAWYTADEYTKDPLYCKTKCSACEETMVQDWYIKWEPQFRKLIPWYIDDPICEKWRVDDVTTTVWYYFWSCYPDEGTWDPTWWKWCKCRRQHETSYHCVYNEENERINQTIWCRDEDCDGICSEVDCDDLDKYNMNVFSQDLYLMLADDWLISDDEIWNFFSADSTVQLINEYFDWYENVPDSIAMILILRKSKSGLIKYLWRYLLSPNTMNKLWWFLNLVKKYAKEYGLNFDWFDADSDMSDEDLRLLEYSTRFSDLMMDIAAREEGDDILGMPYEDVIEEPAKRVLHYLFLEMYASIFINSDIIRDIDFKDFDDMLQGEYASVEEFMDAAENLVGNNVEAGLLLEEFRSSRSNLSELYRSEPYSSMNWNDVMADDKILNDMEALKSTMIDIISRNKSFECRKDDPI